MNQGKGLYDQESHENECEREQVHQREGGRESEQEWQKKNSLEIKFCTFFQYSTFVLVLVLFKKYFFSTSTKSTFTF